MKSIDVDFRPIRRPARWAWALPGVLALAAVSVFVYGLTLKHRIQEQIAQLAELEARAAASPPVVSQTAPKKIPDDASVREYLAQATSQWPEMLTALESVAMVGVTPKAIDVMPSERTMRVEVEYSDLGILLEYIDALNAGEPAPKWSLVHAQTATAAAPGGVLLLSNATIRADW